jgi:hypothetical protein
MTRMKQLLADNVDTSHNLVYSIIVKGLKSVADLQKSLDEILINMLPNTEKTLSRFFQGVLFHLTRIQPNVMIGEAQVLAYLKVCLDNKQSR